MNFNNLPNEIIEYILDNTNIKCKTCQLKFNLNFYKKLSKFYFCSKICYEFI